MERFWAKVEKTDTCWLWTGRTDKDGYGLVWYRGLNRRAHRMSYLEAVGELADDLTIDHLCRVRCCVNPAHLEAVPAGVNVLRGVGPTALNASKTHCDHGHELAGDNLYLSPLGRRKCRACHRREMQAFRARRLVKGA